MTFRNPAEICVSFVDNPDILRHAKLHLYPLWHNLFHLRDAVKEFLLNEYTPPTPLLTRGASAWYAAISRTHLYEEEQ